MVEKTKAGKGASVAKAQAAKTDSVSGQPSALKTNKQWEQPITGSAEFVSESCQDNTPNPVSSPAANLSVRGKKQPQKQAIGEQLGRQLRSVYNDVLAQPVPDRFLDLLKALEKDPK